MTYTHPTAEEIADRRAELAPFDRHNERTWLALYALILAWADIPASYLDLGSGTGAMVNMARRLGIDAVGVDLINGPEHWFVRHDLAMPLFLERRFDLITCLEVAEHLPPEAAPVLADSIRRHMAESGLLIFSAAPPGQQGEHHVNTQPATYWRTLLYERGISYRPDYTARLSHLWAWTAGPLSWLHANVQVFDT